MAVRVQGMSHRTLLATHKAVEHTSTMCHLARLLSTPLPCECSCACPDRAWRLAWLDPDKSLLLESGCVLSLLCG